MRNYQIFITVLLPNISIYISFILNYFVWFPHKATHMHNNHKIWLLLAGDYAPPYILPTPQDTIIAVDGGIYHAEQYGWHIDLWLGDFDSSNKHLNKKNIPYKEYPCDKSQTDFELALEYVENNYNPTEIHILGSGGNEADHEFANLWVLPQTSAPVVLWRKNCTIIKAKDKVNITWHSQAGDKISLFALSPLKGINNQGLIWSVKNAELLPFIAAFARNEAKGGVASISWQSGHGLVFLPPQALVTINVCDDEESQLQSQN